MADDPVPLYYFAYGSNLLPARLLERVPSSQPVGVARLANHRLAWHKVGNDQSGKCDVTESDGGQVWGVIYSLAEGEKPLLDAAESLGAGYALRWQPFNVIDMPEKSALDVFYYCAQPAFIDRQIKPFDWYHQLVLQGAQHHRLPADYIHQLTQIATQSDPDSERALLHRRLLNTEAHRNR